METTYAEKALILGRMLSRSTTDPRVRASLEKARIRAIEKAKKEIPNSF